jgi:hypothetical protein
VKGLHDQQAFNLEVLILRKRLTDSIAPHRQNLGKGPIAPIKIVCPEEQNPGFRAVMVHLGTLMQSHP